MHWLSLASATGSTKSERCAPSTSSKVLLSPLSLQRRMSLRVFADSASLMPFVGQANVWRFVRSDAVVVVSARVHLGLAARGGGAGGGGHLQRAGAKEAKQCGGVFLGDVHADGVGGYQRRGDYAVGTWASCVPGCHR